LTPRTPRDGEAHEARSLASVIAAQAAAEAAQIVADARAAADRVRAAADSEADELQAAARREGEKRGNRRAARLLALVETEGRRRWLEAREALIEEAIHRAAERLKCFAALEGAGEALMALLDEGLRVMPDGPVQAVIPRGYRPLVDETALARLTQDGRQVGVKWNDGPGDGVVLQSESGRLRFDDSFAARIRRRHDRLRKVAAQVLLAEPVMPEATTP
jgi:vacuolar-type H+-ATPase subunit E/Vma4